MKNTLPIIPSQFSHYWKPLTVGLVAGGEDRLGEIQGLAGVEDEEVGEWIVSFVLREGRGGGASPRHVGHCEPTDVMVLS